MARMLDCPVSYFGLDEDGRPGYRRFFCYHVVAGPGPEAGAGLAVVTTLALHDEGERCTSCEAVHRVETGRPAAALAAALRHLDAYHGADHLRKVQTDVRGFDGSPAPLDAHRPGGLSARHDLVAGYSIRSEP